MRLHCFLLIFLLLAIGAVQTGCFSVKRPAFRTGAPSQPKTKTISAEEERTIMEQTNRMFAVGLTAEQQNDLQAAEWAYLECLQYNENRGSVKYVGPPYHRLAVIAARQGKIRKSEEYFRKALELGTENVELACDFAQLLLDTDREHEAATILENALIAFPKDRKLLFFLGHTLAVQNREIEALRRLKGSIGEAAAYHELAQILRDKGNLSGADLMDQKGRLAQQERRKSLDRLDDGLNQELLDEKAMALLTYSSKAPPLGSINRRYGEVLGDQTKAAESVTTPRINPAEVMTKYGRPKFAETPENIFPTLPVPSERSQEAPALAASTPLTAPLAAPLAPTPRAPIAANPLDRETVETSRAPSLPAPPTVPPNQRLAARPNRTTVFPPEMHILSEEGEPAISAQIAENNPIEHPAPIASVTPPPLKAEPQRLAMRDTSLLTGSDLEENNVSTIQEPLLLEDGLFQPITPALPALENPVEETKESSLPNLTFEEPPLFIEVTPAETPKVAPPQPARTPIRVGIAAPPKQEIRQEVKQEEPAPVISEIVTRPVELQIQSPPAPPQNTRVQEIASTMDSTPMESVPMQSLQIVPEISEIPVVPVVPQVGPLAVEVSAEEQQFEPLANTPVTLPMNLPVNPESLQLPMPQLDLLTKIYGPSLAAPTQEQPLQVIQRQSDPPEKLDARIVKSDSVKLQPEEIKSRQTLTLNANSDVPSPPVLKATDAKAPRKISLAKEEEEKTSAPEEVTWRIGGGDKPVVNSKDSNKTVAFSSKTVSLKSPEPASEIVLRTEKKTDTEAAPKKLLKVQPEANFVEKRESSKEKTTQTQEQSGEQEWQPRSLSLSSPSPQTARDAGNRKELTLKL